MTSVFSKEERICHKMVYYTFILHFAFKSIVRNCVTKVRIYTDEKMTFILKGAWHLKG